MGYGKGKQRVIPEMRKSIYMYVRIFYTYEQALVSLKFKKSVDAEGGRTLAVIIEGG